jgi:hypothetical protein
VAGEHAYYFAGKEPEAIANAVQKWLKLYEVEQQPKSNDMPWLTWKQSAIQLMSILVPNAKE